MRIDITGMGDPNLEVGDTEGEEAIIGEGRLEASLVHRVLLRLQVKWDIDRGEGRNTVIGIGTEDIIDKEDIAVDQGGKNIFKLSEEC